MISQCSVFQTSFSYFSNWIKAKRSNGKCTSSEGLNLDLSSCYKPRQSAEKQDWIYPWGKVSTWQANQTCTCDLVAYSREWSLQLKTSCHCGGGIRTKELGFPPLGKATESALPSLGFVSRSPMLLLFGTQVLCGVLRSLLGWACCGRTQTSQLSAGCLAPRRSLRASHLSLAAVSISSCPNRQWCKKKTLQTLLPLWRGMATCPRCSRLRG